MPEQLKQTLERTGFRASLAEEYLTGYAPGTQRKDEHITPESPTYYDLPAIKKPGWIWSIPLYFFVGGLSTGAYIVAALSDIRGREEDRSLVRMGRILALVGMLLTPILLIIDLGRPERWMNMLRVFRPRSMMNVGSWGITIFGLFTGVAAMAQALQDLMPRSLVSRFMLLPLRVFSWLGIIPALFVASYTGLLLSATNVPLWAANRLLMGPLFLSSALSTGMAALHLATRLFGSANQATEERLQRAEGLILGAELAITAASGWVLRGLARPLLTGPLGLTYQVGSIGLGLIVPLALRLRSAPTAPTSLLSSALVLLGGLILRFAMTEGGKRSADDPRAYFEYTRPGR